jgi:hypothetical protein
MSKSISMNFNTDMDTENRKRKMAVPMSTSSDSLSSSSMSKPTTASTATSSAANSIYNQNHPNVSMRPRMRNNREKYSRSNLSQLKSLSTMNIPREIGDFSQYSQNNQHNSSKFSVMPPSISLNNLNFLLTENFDTNCNIRQQATRAVNNYMFLPNISVSEFVNVIRQNLNRSMQNAEHDQKLAEEEMKKKMKQLVTLETDIDTDLFFFITSIFRLLALMLPPSNKVFIQEISQSVSRLVSKYLFFRESFTFC